MGSEGNKTKEEKWSIRALVNLMLILRAVVTMN